MVILDLWEKLYNDLQNELISHQYYQCSNIPIDYLSVIC